MSAVASVRRRRESGPRGLGHVGLRGLGHGVALLQGRSLADAIGEGRLDRRARVQCSQHGDRGDHGAGKLGGDVLGDAGQAQNTDLEPEAGFARRLEAVGL